MGKRTVKAAAPVPAIDDALDLDDARHDLGRSAEDGEEGDHEFDHEFDHDAYDASVSEYELLKQLTEHDEQEGGAEGSGAETASPVPAKAAPVRDVLSKVVEVPAHVQAAFDDAADIMNRAFPAKAETAPDAAPTTTNEEQPASPPEPSPAMAFAIDLPGTPTVVDRVVELNIDDIAPDPEQPRLDVDTDLADSIAAEGVKQPIVVRVHPYAHGFAIVGSGKDIGKATTQVGYIIVDGERRWRASVKAARKTIPARVVADVEDAGDRLLLQVTLNEGKRLAPMEEARAWKRIMDAKSWNIQQLATALGRAKSTVSDRLAMLNAPAAFQPLFEKGVLSPAAAPLVRGLAAVPERFLTALVKELAEDDWHDFIETQTTVPLPEVTRALEGQALHAAGLRRIDHYGAAAKGYTGETVTIGGKKYATDAEQLDKVTTAYYRGGSSREPSAAQQRADEDRRKREANERKKDQARKEKLRTLFSAVSAKLPTSIGGSANQADGWSALLVDLVLKEVHYDTCRVLAAQLALQGEKHTNGSAPYADMIRKYSAKLAAPARVQLALMLLLAPDLAIPSYSMAGPSRLYAAAKLLKLDPKKATAAKKAAKKGGRR